MNPNVNRKSDSSLFEDGDVDVAVLKNTLNNRRAIDSVLLEKLNIAPERIRDLNQKQAIEAFNMALDSPKLILKVDVEFLTLSPEIRRLIKLARLSMENKEHVDIQLIRTINRALLQSLYPNELIKTRKYQRFSSPEMANAQVNLKTIPPAVEKSYEGRLLNISAGGMALLMDQKLEPGVFLALNLRFMDGSEIETLVQIRHAVPKEKEFIHGFQFISIPSFISEKMATIAKDYNACEDRIQKQDPEICRSNCSFHSMCTKPQRIPKSA